MNRSYYRASTFSIEHNTSFLFFFQIFCFNKNVLIFELNTVYFKYVVLFSNNFL